MIRDNASFGAEKPTVCIVEMMGRNAGWLTAADAGKTGEMIILKRDANDPYECGTSSYDIHQIANVERPVPDEFIGADGCSITDEYIKYARPLIMGELTPVYVNGLPRHILCREVMEYEK